MAQKNREIKKETWSIDDNQNKESDNKEDSKTSQADNLIEDNNSAKDVNIEDKLIVLKINMGYFKSTILQLANMMITKKYIVHYVICLAIVKIENKVRNNLNIVDLNPTLTLYKFFEILTLMTEIMMKKNNL